MKRLLFAGLTTSVLFFSVSTIPAIALNARFNTARHQTLDKLMPNRNTNCSTAQGLQFDPECKG